MSPPKEVEQGENSDPLPEEQGEIRCICGFSDDDGYTVQCENCNVWQHVVCVINENENVPDEYLCEICEPRQLDAKKARERQLARIDEEYQSSQESRRRGHGSVNRSRKALPANDDIHQSTSGIERRRKSSTIKQRGRPPKPTSINTSFDDHQPHDNIDSSAHSVSTDRVSALSERFAADSEKVLEVFNETVRKFGLDNVEIEGNKPFVHVSNSLSVLAPETVNSTVALHTGTGLGSDPPMKGVFITEPILEGSYIGEYKGQVDIKSSYTDDPKNYFNLLKTSRPYIAFYPNLELYIDPRKHGGKLRHLRKSCKPNTSLRCTYYKDSQDSFIHLGVFALRNIERDEELTIGWSWETGDVPNIVNRSQPEISQYLSTPEGRRLSKIWRQAFTGYSCGCNHKHDCKVTKLLKIFGVNSGSSTSPSSGSTNGHRRKKSNQSKSSIKPQTPSSPLGSSFNMVELGKPRKPTKVSPGHRRSESPLTKKIHIDEDRVQGDSKGHKRKSHSPESIRHSSPYLEDQHVKDNSDLRSKDGDPSNADKRRRRATDIGHSNSTNGKYVRKGSAPNAPLKKVWLKQYLEKIAFEKSLSQQDVSDGPFLDKGNKPHKKEKPQDQVQAESSIPQKVPPLASPSSQTTLQTVPKSAIAIEDYSKGDQIENHENIKIAPAHDLSSMDGETKKSDPSKQKKPSLTDIKEHPKDASDDNGRKSNAATIQVKRKGEESKDQKEDKQQPQPQPQKHRLTLSEYTKLRRLSHNVSQTSEQTKKKESGATDGESLKQPSTQQISTLESEKQSPSEHKAEDKIKDQIKPDSDKQPAEPSTVNEPTTADPAADKPAPRVKMSLQEYNRRRVAVGSNSDQTANSDKPKPEASNDISDIIQQELAGIVDPTFLSKKENGPPPTTPSPSSSGAIVKRHTTSLTTTSLLQSPPNKSEVKTGESLSFGKVPLKASEISADHTRRPHTPPPSTNDRLGPMHSKIGPRDGRRGPEDPNNHQSQRQMGPDGSAFSPVPPPPPPPPPMHGSRYNDQGRKPDRDHYGGGPYTGRDRYDYGYEAGSGPYSGGSRSSTSGPYPPGSEYSGGGSYRPERGPPPPPPSSSSQVPGKGHRGFLPPSHWDRNRRSSPIYTSHYSRNSNNRFHDQRGPSPQKAYDHTGGGGASSPHHSGPHGAPK
ncbi:SET domain-containing protein 3 [Mycoemilia scoparia]|uniref:SET domain-containing protein 3 n=1 Tax=Mycoemilia scoparia TaxID=417184 RepID=A0A9W8A4C1_9FUNG|nr:SET domain-containing protein 3 [Mycoemilia scoparia]